MRERDPLASNLQCKLATLRHTECAYYVIIGLSMIDRIIGWSIDHRTLTILGGLLLALWGVYAVYHTPVDAIPDLSENQVIVFTDWPGHSPQEIENQITYPLSLSLEGLTGVRVV